MTMKSSSSILGSLKSLSPLLAVAGILLAGTSCKTTSAGGEYGEYGTGTDASGGYNPYPSSGGGTDQYQQYQQYQQQPAQQQGGYQQQYSQYPQQQQYQQYTPPQQSYSEPSYSSYEEPAPRKKSTGTKKKSSGGGYTVKKGDTLYRIALNNNVTVSKLKSANGLTSDIIRPGQSLVIP